MLCYNVLPKSSSIYFAYHTLIGINIIFHIIIIEKTMITPPNLTINKIINQFFDIDILVICFFSLQN